MNRSFCGCGFPNDPKNPHEHAKHTDGSTLGHRFEKLGYKPPFAFFGYEESVYQACPGAHFQPGTSCDYCGTGIKHVFWVLDGDLKKFKVGSDCIGHLGSEKLVVLVESKMRQVNRSARQENQNRKIEALKPEYKKALEVLQTVKHPHEFFANRGLTMADYYRYISKNLHNMKEAIRKAADFETKTEKEGV